MILFVRLFPSPLLPMLPLRILLDVCVASTITCSYAFQVIELVYLFYLFVQLSLPYKRVLQSLCFDITIGYCKGLSIIDLKSFTFTCFRKSVRQLSSCLACSPVENAILLLWLPILTSVEIVHVSAPYIASQIPNLVWR